jgi:hypothetical protein
MDVKSSEKPDRRASAATAIQEGTVVAEPADAELLGKLSFR